MDPFGHPILPTHHVVHLKSRQAVVREIFTKAYCKFNFSYLNMIFSLQLVRITKWDRAHVPWLELARMPAEYLDIDTIPEGFKILDPSKLTKNRISELWCHWSKRAKAKQPILRFIKARDQDLGMRARYEMDKPQVVQKRVAYVDLSDDETSDDELDGHAGKRKNGSDKGKGTSGSSIRPPPSKRPRLSRQLAVAEEQSPAANNSNRSKFLYSLSSDALYKTLLSRVSALPVFVSLFSFHLYGFV